jgi:hypothetical protein
MPLRPLADEIVHLSHRNVSTPVLVTPSYLSLRKRFFLELVGSLAEISQRSIRIDWYRGVPGLLSLISHRLASVRSARINRALSSNCRTSNCRTNAAIQVTASIGRPSRDRPELVIGLCDQRLDLPAWTTPIRLGASPDELSALQSASGRLSV